jgi:hypothetical protein
VLKNPRFIEEKIADAVFESLKFYENADVLKMEQTEEVYESKYYDEEYIPV